MRPKKTTTRVREGPLSTLKAASNPTAHLPRFSMVLGQVPWSISPHWPSGPHTRDTGRRPPLGHLVWAVAPAHVAMKGTSVAQNTVSDRYVPSWYAQPEAESESYPCCAKDAPVTSGKSAKVSASNATNQSLGSTTLRSTSGSSPVRSWRCKYKSLSPVKSSVWSPANP